MKNFASGMNNFVVGLFSGLLLPIVIIMVLLFMTVDKITSFAQDEAIAPLYQRGAQTLDKVDALIMTLDNKVDNADLQDIKLLSPLKEANVFPELKQLARSVQMIREAAEDKDKQAVIDGLKEKLQQSFSNKFPEEQAQQLADNFANIAQIMANKKEQLVAQKEQLQNKTQDIKGKAQEKIESVTDKTDQDAE
ncbi:hypothetical protein [Vibrio sp. S17_S38]|uniref:hypothetical protein n=1 Tax=Vibrio sp. S17_S38 TaxID=2720229 RepID=UPI00193404DB|nr:hypothetical protein [Vibrio sp. S17_S38]